MKRDGWKISNFELFFALGFFVLVTSAAGVYFETRLADIENQLEFAPAQSYEPPDVADYPVKHGPVADLDVHLVYVPVYSHIYFHGGSPYPLETTLSIRNVDHRHPVFIRSVRYFNTDGELSKTCVDEVIELAPLQTIEFLVKQVDSTGGSGANFLVEWMAGESTNGPLIEAVMVGTEGTFAISFGRTGIDVETD